MEPGATLLLCTDGLFERRGESLDVSLERLRATIETLADRDVQKLCDDLVAGMFEEGRQTDDLAVVALRLARSPVEPFIASLPAEPGRVADVRHRLAQWLSTVGVGTEERHDVILAAGEALANAVEHAYREGPGDVHIDARRPRPDELVVVVRDHGRWRDPPAPGNRGRGHALIRRLVDDLDVERRGGGTTVRMRRRFRSHATAASSGAE